MAKALGFEPSLAVLETAVLAVEHYADMVAEVGFEPTKTGL